MTEIVMAGGSHGECCADLFPAGRQKVGDIAPCCATMPRFAGMVPGRAPAQRVGLLTYPKSMLWGLLARALPDTMSVCQCVIV